MNMTSREFMIPCIKHDGHYFKFCILRSIVLKQIRKSVGLCQTFLQVPQRRSDKTITSSKTIVKLSERTVSVFLNQRLTVNHKSILVRSMKRFRHDDFVNSDIVKTGDKSSLRCVF